MNSRCVVYSVFIATTYNRNFYSCELQCLPSAVPLTFGVCVHQKLCGLFDVDLPFSLSSVICLSGSVLPEAVNMQWLEDWNGVMMVGGLCNYTHG